MATDRPKTTEEAQRLIIQQKDAIRPLLRQALSSGDRATAEKYMNEMQRLDQMMRATAEVTVGGVKVPIGQIGAGLQSGISGLLTGLPDIAVGAANLLAPKGGEITSLGGLATKYLGVQNEPASQETAYPFRIAQGVGSTGIPGAGKKGLLLGAALPTGDVAVSEAIGLPEGVISGAYAVGSLTRAGWKGIKDFQENKKFKQFLADNIPNTNDQNVFKEFMLRGQGSDSPVVAASIQKLRSNPEYAELFARFDKAASDFATKGMTPATQITGAGAKQQVAESIATRVERQIEGLRQQRSESADRIFTQAKGYGGDRAIVDSNETIAQIDKLIGDYSKKKTGNADTAVSFLSKLRSRLVDDNNLPKKLTVDETQAVLSEFGKNATLGNSLVKDLALTDETRISAAIFGGLKDDLRNARVAAKSVEDKAATGLLLQARDQVRKASDEYNEAISQGLPAFLKDKPLSSISYEDIYSNYKGLNEYQRAKLRAYVGGTDQESLNFLDRNIFQDFVKSAQGKNDSGVLTTDLEKLATNWKLLGDNEKSSLITALGTNAKEFDQRMADALTFTRRMKVGRVAGAEEDLISQDLKRGISASIGAGLGYSPSKASDVAMIGINELIKKQGLNDEQLMRVLLTPEGANFLRQGALTGASAKTLDALTNVPTAAQELMTKTGTPSAISRLMPKQTPTDQGGDGVYVPEELFAPQTAPQVPSGQEDGVFVPEDIFQTNPQPQNNLTEQEKNQVLNMLGASPRPSPYSNLNPQLQP
jgi:hypothetical protein